MIQYQVIQPFQGLAKDQILLPVPGYSDPIPFATQSEIDKEGGAKQMWFASFLNDNPEIFKQVNS
jgi:hypothetical protein